jgi:hypothetical protein
LSIFFFFFLQHKFTSQDRSNINTMPPATPRITGKMTLVTLLLLLLVEDPDVLSELLLDLLDTTAPGGGGGDGDEDDDCEEPDFGADCEEEDCEFPGDEVGDWVDVGREGVEDGGGEVLLGEDVEVEEGGDEAGVSLVGGGGEAVEFEEAEEFVDGGDEVGDVVFVEFEDIFAASVL